MELNTLIEAFLSNKNIFDPFLDKKVMEKYVGYLDGRNTQRNIEKIKSLLER